MEFANLAQVFGDASTISTFAVQYIVGILTLRLLPFSAWALCSADVPRWGKVWALVAYACVAGAALYFGSAEFVVALAIGLVALTLLSGCVHWLAGAFRAKLVTRGAVFALCVVAFIVLPGLFSPRVVLFAMLSIGWELMLSGYSYCVEVGRRKTSPALRDCLFFLMVNPTLVYTERGERVAAPRLEWRGLARVALGMTAMVFGAAILRPLYSFVDEYGDVFIPLPLLSLVLFGALRALSEYAAHSGLASIQIGIMRQLGYQVPERYNYPFLASSPLDFWRRWNTYVGGWLRQYVFMPGMMFAGRRTRAPWAMAVVLTVVFVVSGLLHDIYGYAISFDTDPRYLLFFLVVAAVTFLWIGAARAGRWVATRFLPEVVGSSRIASRVLHLGLLILFGMALGGLT